MTEHKNALEKSFDSSLVFEGKVNVPLNVFSKKRKKAKKGALKRRLLKKIKGK